MDGILQWIAASLMLAIGVFIGTRFERWRNEDESLQDGTERLAREAMLSGKTRYNDHR